MRLLLALGAVVLALSASMPPAAACSWLNEAYTLGPGAYAAGHGISQEAVAPVSFGSYLGVNVVDDHSPHVWFVACIERPGDIAGQCSAANGDTEISGMDRIETTVTGEHGLAHVFIATLHVADDGSTQTATTGRVYFWFTSDCAASPPLVGPGLGAPSL